MSDEQIGRLSSGEWRCIRDDVTEPCGSCGGCQEVEAEKLAHAAHGYVRIKVDDTLVEQIAETLRTTAANGSAGTYDYRLARAVVAALREAAQ